MAYREYDKTDVERLLDRLDRIADALEMLTAQVDASDEIKPDADLRRTLEPVHQGRSYVPTTWDLAFEQYMFKLHIVEGCNCYNCIEWYNRHAAALHRHMTTLKEVK